MLGQLTICSLLDHHPGSATPRLQISLLCIWPSLECCLAFVWREQPEFFGGGGLRVTQAVCCICSTFLFFQILNLTAAASLVCWCASPDTCMGLPALPAIQPPGYTCSWLHCHQHPRVARRTVRTVTLLCPRERYSDREHTTQHAPASDRRPSAV